MKKQLDAAMVDGDNPEWTDAEFAKAKRMQDLPVALQAKLRRPRGPQKEPTKVATTIRLSRDVLDQFKASGVGWQTRMDSALRDWLKDHQPR